MHRDFEREAWRDLEPLGVVGGEQEFPVTKQVCPCRGLLFPFSQMPSDNPGEVKMRPGGRYALSVLVPSPTQ